MQCDRCQQARYCSMKGEVARKVLFSYPFWDEASKEAVTCSDFKPRWWHGVEGVAA